MYLKYINTSIVICSLMLSTAALIHARTSINLETNGNANTDINIKSNDTTVSYKDSPQTEPTIIITPGQGETSITINNNSYTQNSCTNNSGAIKLRQTQISTNINNLSAKLRRIRQGLQLLSSFSQSPSCISLQDHTNQLTLDIDAYQERLLELNQAIYTDTLRCQSGQPNSESHRLLQQSVKEALPSLTNKINIVIKSSPLIIAKCYRFY